MSIGYRNKLRRRKHDVVVMLQHNTCLIQDKHFGMYKNTFLWEIPTTNSSLIGFVHFTISTFPFYYFGTVCVKVKQYAEQLATMLMNIGCIFARIIPEFACSKQLQCTVTGTYFLYNSVLHITNFTIMFSGIFFKGLCIYSLYIHQKFGFILQSQKRMIAYRHSAVIKIILIVPPIYWTEFHSL